MPTGLEWSKHFQTQDVCTRTRIVEALEELLKDRLFAINYGHDFREIISLIAHPIKDK